MKQMRKFLDRYRMIDEGRKELDRVIKIYWEKRYPKPPHIAGQEIGASKTEIEQWAKRMVERNERKKGSKRSRILKAI